MSWRNVIYGRHTDELEHVSSVSLCREADWVDFVTDDVINCCLPRRRQVLAKTVGNRLINGVPFVNHDI